MEDNVSARFVPKLADLAARRFPGHRVVSRLLPTEWEAAPVRLAAWYAREKPRLALHFGVSGRAEGFVIETLARNTACAKADATGALPEAACVAPGGPNSIEVRLPTSEIAKRLGALGLPVAISDDAGDYLCNAILYKSLAICEAPGQTAAAGFIHLPVSLPRREKGDVADGSALDWEGALAGGLEIIRTCLGRPATTRRPALRPRVKPR
jgi:pyroglutamyl-peptidase